MLLFLWLITFPSGGSVMCKTKQTKIKPLFFFTHIMLCIGVVFCNYNFSMNFITIFSTNMASQSDVFISNVHYSKIYMDSMHFWHS